MDVVLDICDTHFFNDFYQNSLFSNAFHRPDFIWRQFISLYLITITGAFLQYLLVAAFNYYVFFDKSLMKHPKFLKNQIRREITLSLTSLPTMGVLTVVCFLAEIRGYASLYRDPFERGIPYLVLSVFTFLFFTDMLIYWIHRYLHHPLVYTWLHKPHHLWKIPTPFASHAFHPLDGFLQSIPYHIYVFLFPMSSYLYLALFVFVNFWTISIHDGNCISFNPWINGAAHHIVHHLEFNYNYGQYFTFWDRIGGSHKEPEPTLEQYFGEKFPKMKKEE